MKINGKIISVILSVVLIICLFNNVQSNVLADGNQTTEISNSEQETTKFEENYTEQATTKLDELSTSEESTTTSSYPNTTISSNSLESFSQKSEPLQVTQETQSQQNKDHAFLSDDVEAAPVNSNTLTILESSAPFSSDSKWSYTNNVASESIALQYKISQNVTGENQTYYFIVDINPYEVPNFPFTLNDLPEAGDLGGTTTTSVHRISSTRAYYKIQTNDDSLSNLVTTISVSLSSDESVTSYSDNNVETLAAVIGDTLVDNPKAQFGLGIMLSQDTNHLASGYSFEKSFTFLGEHEPNFDTQTSIVNNLISNLSIVQYNATGSIKINETSITDTSEGTSKYQLWLVPDGSVYFGTGTESEYIIDTTALKLDLTNEDHYPISDFTININLPDGFTQNESLSTEFSGTEKLGYGNTPSYVVYGNSDISKTSLITTSFTKQEMHYFEGSLKTSGTENNFISFTLTQKDTDGSNEIKAINDFETYTEESYTATEESIITWKEYNPVTGEITEEEHSLGYITINVAPTKYIDTLSSNILTPQSVNEFDAEGTKYNFELVTHDPDPNNAEDRESYRNGLVTFTINPNQFAPEKLSISNMGQLFTEYWTDNDTTKKTFSAEQTEIDVTGAKVVYLQLGNDGLNLDYFSHTNKFKYVEGYFTGKFRDTGEGAATVFVDIIDAKNSNYDLAGNTSVPQTIDREVRLEDETSDMRSIDLVWPYKGYVDNLEIYLEDFGEVVLNDNGDSTGGGYIYLHRESLNPEDIDKEESRIQSIAYKNLTFTITTEEDIHLNQISALSILNGYALNEVFSIEGEPILKYKTNQNSNFREHTTKFEVNGSQIRLDTIALNPGEYFTELQVVIPSLSIIADGTTTSGSSAIKRLEERLIRIVYDTNPNTLAGQYEFSSSLPSIDSFINVEVYSDSFFYKDIIRDAKDVTTFKPIETVSFSTDDVIVYDINANYNNNFSLSSVRFEIERGHADGYIYGTNGSAGQIRLYNPEGTAVYFKLNTEYFRYVGDTENVSVLQNGDETWLRYLLSQEKYIGTSQKNDDNYIQFSNAFQVLPGTTSTGPGESYPLFLEAYLDMGPLLGKPVENMNKNDFVQKSYNMNLQDGLTSGYGEYSNPSFTANDILGLTQEIDELYDIDEEEFYNVVRGEQDRFIDLGVYERVGLDDGYQFSKVILNSDGTNWPASSEVISSNGEVPLIPRVTVTGAQVSGVRIGLSTGDEHVEMEKEYYAHEHDDLKLHVDVTKIENIDDFKVTININEDNNIGLLLNEFYDETDLNGWQITYIDKEGAEVVVAEDTHIIEIKFVGENTDYAGESFVFNIKTDLNEITNVHTEIDGTLSKITAQATGSIGGVESMISSSSSFYALKWYEIGGIAFIDTNENGVFDATIDKYMVDKPSFMDGDTEISSSLISYNSASGKYTIKIQPKTEIYDLSYQLNDGEKVTSLLGEGSNISINNNHPINSGMKFKAGAEAFSVLDKTSANLDEANAASGQNISQFELEQGMIDIGVYEVVANTYPVIFEDIDGESTKDVITDEDSNVEEGSIITETENQVVGMKPEGMIEGWYTDPNFSEESKWVFEGEGTIDLPESEVTGPTTLYPLVKYPVIFKEPAGSIGEIKTDDVEYKGVTTKPTAEDLEGHIPSDKVVVGWYTDENCTAGNEWDFDTVITGPVILYPKLEDKVPTPTSTQMPTPTSSSASVTTAPIPTPLPQTTSITTTTTVVEDVETSSTNAVSSVESELHETTTTNQGIIVPTLPNQEVDRVEVGEETLTPDDYHINEEGELEINQEYISTLPDGVYEVVAKIGDETYVAQIIVENGSPLSSSPFIKMGAAWSLFDLVMTIIVFGFMALMLLKHREEKEELAETDDQLKTSEEERRRKQKRKMTYRLLEIILFIVILLFLIFTQDFTLPMAIFDKYSLYFGLLAILGLFIFVSFNNTSEEDEEGSQLQKGL